MVQGGVLIQRGGGGLAQAGGDSLGVQHRQSAGLEDIGSQDGRVARRIARRGRQLQSPLGEDGVWDVRIEPHRPLEGPREQAGGGAEASIQAWCHQGSGVARSAGARVVRLNHDRLAAEGADGARGGCAGDPGADDRHPSDDGFGVRARHWGVGEVSLETLTLAAVAGAFLSLETRVCQCSAHAASHGESRRLRAGRRTCGDPGQHLGCPHLRVHGRRETVEEPGVGPACPLGECDVHIANTEIQDGAELRELDPVETGRAAGPARHQGLGDRRELGPPRQGLGCVVGGERVGLNREDVKTAVGGAGPAPEVQQGCDVQAGSEPQLANHEPLAAAPGAGQAAALEKHQLAFGQAVFS